MIGLFGNSLLMLIAVFIFLAASGEAGYVQARDYMRGYLARQAMMISAYQTLSPASTADDAAASLLLRTTQQEFPVVDGGGVLKGMLTRRGLIAGLTDRGGAMLVTNLMQEVPEVQETACLDSVFPMLQRAPGLVGVVDAQRRLVGYISAENLTELVMIQSSRATTATPSSAAPPLLAQPLKDPRIAATGYTLSPLRKHPPGHCIRVQTADAISHWRHPH